MNPYLVASRASFHRYGEPVFYPVDLTLGAQGLCIISGKNGSGKTTLLRMLAGIIPPSEGRLQKSGSVAFIGHKPGLKDDLSTLDNLEFYRQFAGPHRSRLSASPVQALKLAGLASKARHRAGQLSAGQRRRLGLARLLVAPKDVWLLDEPYTSLDAAGCQWVDELLYEHLSAGGGAIVAAHLRKPVVNVTIEHLEIHAPRRRDA